MRRHVALLLAAATAACVNERPQGIAAPPASSSDAAIHLRISSGGVARIDVTGLSPEQLDALRGPRMNKALWLRVLALYIAPADGPQTTPTLGAHRVDGADVSFTPRFPMRPGVKYIAVFDPSAIPGAPPPVGRRLEAPFSLPTSPAAPRATVQNVYPSANVLPENLLKFYIHFSAPMSRGESYRHIRLLDAAGKPVPDAILEIGEELWDADGRRLTLLFDPGRIKRGLKPREEVGTSLVAGRAYSLVIGREWRDARRQPLAAEFVKEFTTGPPDDRQPDPRHWKLAPPAAGTCDSLVVALDEPLDHALVQRLVRVVGPAENETPGDVTVDEHETRWRFQPTAAWQAGTYRLVVEPELEDLAGNSVGRPFEVDQFAPPGESAAGESDSAGGRTLSFKITAAP